MNCSRFNRNAMYIWIEKIFEIQNHVLGNFRTHSRFTLFFSRRFRKGIKSRAGSMAKSDISDFYVDDDLEDVFHRQLKSLDLEVGFSIPSW